MEITYGFIESDLNMCFHVHRETLMRASPVWNAMLRGDFNERSSNTLIFEDDDPSSIKFILDVLYGNHLTNDTPTECDHNNLSHLIDKYSLNCGLRFNDLLQSEQISQLYHGRVGRCEDHLYVGDIVNLEGDNYINGNVTAINQADDTLSVQWNDGVFQTNVRYFIATTKPVSLRNVFLYALACTMIVIIGTGSRSH